MSLVLYGTVLTVGALIGVAAAYWRTRGGCSEHHWSEREKLPRLRCVPHISGGRHSQYVKNVTIERKIRWKCEHGGCDATSEIWTHHRTLNSDDFETWTDLAKVVQKAPSDTTMFTLEDERC